jgi:hypothetical protein
MNVILKYNYITQKTFTPMEDFVKNSQNLFVSKTKIVSIILSSTRFEQTSSSSGGYFCTYSIYMHVYTACTEVTSDDDLV